MAKAKKKAANGNQASALPQSVAPVQDDDLTMLVQYVNQSDDATVWTREMAEKCRRYYDSEQWTRDEIAKLDQQKQAATVINRIKPKMDGLMGMEKANRTTVKTFARTPKHDKASTAATEAVRFVLQDNFYHQIRSEAWENALIEGTCGVEVIVEPKGEDNRITINHLMWDRLVYDPHSRRKDLSDARYLGQVVWMDFDDAAVKYPQARDILESMQTGSATYDDQPRWMDNTRKRVKIVELYWRKPDGKVWYACFTRGGYCEGPKVSPYVNEEGATEWPYEFASLFVMRSGDRYGAVRQYLDVQDEINKRRSKALHLMSVRQVRWERGAVEDINKARAELAKPDGVLETTPGMEFEVLKTGDMAAAQFNLLAEAKQEIDAVGYNAAASGKEDRSMSGVALRTREVSAQTELGPMFDVLRHLDVRVYRKIWNRIRQYWGAEKWIRVTDDENNLKWVGLNKPVTRGEQMLEQAQAAGTPPDMLAQLQQRIAADPLMQEIVETQNEMAALDMDITMIDAPDVVTTQVEDFQVLGEMVKSGFPMPPIAVIEASPLSNKEKIIKLMKEAPQLSPQHQEQMQKMQEGAQKLQEDNVKLAQENQSLKADQQTEQAKIVADQQAKRAELELKAWIQSEELRLEREKAQAEIELERERAAAQIEIERMKADAARERDAQKLAFDQQCRAQDEAHKVTTENSVTQEKMMPQVIEMLNHIIEKQNEFHAGIIAKNDKPRSIVLQMDSAGRPIGAVVN